MINLLKANFYRLRKSKLFRILLIGMLMIVIGMSLVCFLDEEFFFMIGVNYDGSERHGFYIGHIEKVSPYIEYLRSSLGFMFFTCIAVLFLIGDTVVSPFKNGAIKSSLSYGHSRSNLYIVQLVTNIVGTWIITGLMILVSLGTLLLLFQPEHTISARELNLMIKIGLVILCVMSAMVSIYQLLAAIFKSKSVVTTVGALFIAIGTSLLFELVSGRAKQFIPAYMIMNLCGDPTRTVNFIVYVIHSVMIITVTSVIGCRIYQKLEIK